MKYLLHIGAQKAGSSYLHNLLAQDPKIATHAKKEPKYFSKPVFEGTDYHSMFRVVPETAYILDSSPAYLHIEGVAERIHNQLGDKDVTVVVSFRDPIERAVSGYLHNVKHGRDVRSNRQVFSLESTTPADIFDEETALIKEAEKKGLVAPDTSPETAYYDPLFSFRYVSNSLYQRQLEPYLRLFNDIIYVDFEDLKKDPAQATNRVREHANLRDPVDFKLQVGRNRTKFDRWSVFRKATRLGANLPSATYRLFTQSYDAGRIAQHMDTGWRKSILDDYATFAGRAATVAPPLAR